MMHLIMHLIISFAIMPKVKVQKPFRFNLLSTEKLMASDMKQLLKSFHLNAWLSVLAREDQDLVIANTSGKLVPIKWERPFVGQLPQADTKLHLNFSSKTLACSAQ